MDSNHRPPAYQADALTGWAISPCLLVISGQWSVISYSLLNFPSSLIFEPLSSLCFYNCACRIANCELSWWRYAGSNRRPPACKAGALPAELYPHMSSGKWKVVSGKFFITCFPLSFTLLKNNDFKSEIWPWIWSFLFLFHVTSRLWCHASLLFAFPLLTPTRLICYAILDCFTSQSSPVVNRGLRTSALLIWWA